MVQRSNARNACPPRSHPLRARYRGSYKGSVNRPRIVTRRVLTTALLPPGKAPSP
jgi:hypothetical protein